jgi:hypothetical protein
VVAGSKGAKNTKVPLGSDRNGCNVGERERRVAIKLGWTMLLCQWNGEAASKVSGGGVIDADFSQMDLDDPEAESACEWGLLM